VARPKASVIGRSRAESVALGDTGWRRILLVDRFKGGAVSKPERDVEKGYSTVEVVEKLRRLADALETGRPFRIQVSGERIRVPARAEFTIEHERDSDTEEVEFQLKWSLEEDDDSAGDDTIV
jgi:amphi-Trp domain-containing protein